MAINVFEGGRRVARLFMALWAIGVIAIFAFGDRPTVEATFVVSKPGAAPTRTDADCAYDDAREYDSSRKTPRGTGYRLELCFTAYRFPKGKLIPFKVDSAGSTWGDEKYSREVTRYTEQVLESFALSPEDEAWIDSQRWRVVKNHVASAVGWVIGGVLGIWIVSLTIGWILRGFMGIPAGRDAKPGVSSE